MRQAAVAQPGQQAVEVTPTLTEPCAIACERQAGYDHDVEQRRIEVARVDPECFTVDHRQVRRRTVGDAPAGQRRDVRFTGQRVVQQDAALAGPTGTRSW